MLFGSPALKVFPPGFEKGERAMSERFSLGQLLITPGAQSALTEEDVRRALSRHMIGDWGEVCDEDSMLNDEAIKNGTRVLSAYSTTDGVRF